MFEKRVGRFSTVTRYRELIHREIFQIDLCLIEARLMNHGPNLFAKGTIKRQIQYFELDGGHRKIEDTIQFTISMGESFNGSLSVLQTELFQDYFIFQPAPNDSHLAVLEQGFLLEINSAKLEKSSKSNKLKVNSVTQQGQDSTFIQIPFKPLTPGGQPEKFTGKVNFTDCNNLPVAVAEIEGNIYEKTVENILNKIFLKEKVTLLINAPAPSQDQKLVLSGDILEVDWQPDVGQSSTKMILRLDYRWYLTTPKELLCQEPDIENDLPVEQVETLVLKDSGVFHFARSFQMEMPNLKELIEIKLEEFHYQNFWTQKGILLHIDLTLGYTFTNLDGIEQYQEYQTYIDELFPRVLPMSQNPKSVITAVLNSKIVEFAYSNRQITVILDFEYLSRIFQKQITAIVKDDSSSEVIDAKIFSGEKVYSFSAVENFTMKFRPLRIIKVTGRLLEATGLAHEGWVSIKGVIEMNVTYIDHQKKLHEDLFQSNIKDFCIWGELKPEMELEVESDLEYNHYRLSDKNIEYQFLVKIAMKAFHQKRIGIRIAAESSKLDLPTEFEPKQNLKSPVFFDNLVIEWDMPLLKGCIHEIAKSQVQISRFHYQESQNAILIKGYLTGELEYWDQKQYLQKLSLDLPFWRFIPNDKGLQLMNGKLIPTVLNCSYSPFQTLPWRKRSLKIRLELGLEQIEEDELT